MYQTWKKQCVASDKEATNAGETCLSPSLFSSLSCSVFFFSPLFPECVARVPVSLGGLGVRLCSPKVAFATATVRNRSQPLA